MGGEFLFFARPAPPSLPLLGRPCCVRSPIACCSSWEEFLWAGMAVASFYLSSNPPTFFLVFLAEVTPVPAVGWSWRDGHTNGCRQMVLSKGIQPFYQTSHHPEDFNHQPSSSNFTLLNEEKDGGEPLQLSFMSPIRCVYT